MSLPASRKASLLPSLLAALAVLLPASACPAQSYPQKRNSPPAQWKTFHEPGLSFEFQYPANFQVHAHVGPQNGFTGGSIVKPGSRWGISLWPGDSNGLYGTGPFVGMSLEQFAIERVKGYHSADGPDGRIYCTDVLRKNVVWSPQHLEVVVFYLAQVSEEYDPPSTTQKVIGPFCAVLLPGLSIRALILEITGPNPQPPGSEKILKKIAVSVSLAH